MGGRIRTEIPSRSLELNLPWLTDRRARKEGVPEMRFVDFRHRFQLFSAPVVYLRLPSKQVYTYLCFLALHGAILENCVTFGQHFPSRDVLALV